MTWFEALVGFPELSGEQVRGNLVVSRGVMTSKVNGSSYRCGALEIPRLRELRERTEHLRQILRAENEVTNIVASVQDLHKCSRCNGAMFQVASQFNLLEMINPEITPEHGVGIYENDNTQGPSCAVACGAGTIFRNYFIKVNGQIGQSKHNQIDCLHDLRKQLHLESNSDWELRNGYLFVSKPCLHGITERLACLDVTEMDILRSSLRVGVQWNAEVTVGGANIVSQAYCSAAPVAYSDSNSDLWEPLATLILEGAYEATLLAALLNREQTGSSDVYLTLLGGGVFGNRKEWIFRAIRWALGSVKHCGLNVKIVTFRSPDSSLKELLSNG